MLTRVGIVGISVCVIGWILAVVTCILPKWRWFVYYKVNIGASANEGLWMYCGSVSGCTVYTHRLTPDLEAGRGMTVVSILMGLLGFVLPLVGVKYTTMGEVTRAKILIVSCVNFIIAGVLVLIPVSWSAHRTIYVPRWPNLIISGTGPSLYVGWASAALLVFGGIVLLPLACTNLNSARAAGQNRNDIH